MLGPLSDADWSVEKAVMKDKVSISPSVIIAKCQVNWPGKSLHKSVGQINFGYTGLLTPPPSSNDLAVVNLANFGNLSAPSPGTARTRHPHFGPPPSAKHKLCKAHGWRLDHDTEDCYPLRDLRRELANRNSSVQRGRGRGRGGFLRGARANVMDVMLPDKNPNAIPVKDRGGEGNVNSTMAVSASNAFDYLSCCNSSSPSAH